MRVCNCSMFCCTLLNVHSSIAIILMGKRKLIALLNLSSWCLVMVGRLFLAVPLGCLRFVIVVFPDHTHLLFFTYTGPSKRSESCNWLAWFSSYFFKRIMQACAVLSNKDIYYWLRSTSLKIYGFEVWPLLFCIYTNLQLSLPL